ncbi:MAG: SPASM domain-containing protein [Ekhidna sp.]
MRFLKDLVVLLVPIRVAFFIQSLKHRIKLKETSLVPLSDIDISTEGGLEKKIQRISFEISNTCNYTSIHPECPVSCYKSANILDKKIVFKVIDELKELNYSGYIAFHRYNEPMINKERLYAYLEYINNALPNAKMAILTNGSYLNQEEVDTLDKFNVWSVSVSAYSKKEYIRLKKLTTNKIKYSIFYSVLDARLSVYEKEPLDLKMPCYTTIRDITINCHGQLALCCFDWNNEVTFGSLKENSLSELLNSPRFLDAHDNLTAGNRKFEVCRRCDTCR